MKFLLILWIHKIILKRKNENYMQGKAQLILLILLLFIGARSTAQDLQPIFTNEFSSFLFNVHRDTLLIDEALVDTIDGKIWTHFYRSSFAEGSGSNGLGPGLIGYYRTEDRRVYYTNGLSIGLMYDFNLEAGEEARVLPWAGSTLQADTVVYLVDSVKYMNCAFDDSVKVMHLTPYLNYSERRFYEFSSVWIEGIGDTQHPFPPKFCLMRNGGCETIDRWSKYYLNGTWYELWNSEGTAQLPCEEIITSTRSPVVNTPVKLSPNPISSGGELSINAGDFTVEKLSLIGLADGRLVAEWDVVPGSVLALDVPVAIPPGIYVLLLADRAGRVARERVVVR